MRYQWWCNGGYFQGEEATYDEAYDQLKYHVPWLDDAWEVEVDCDDGTGQLHTANRTYFFQTEEESEEDDGAYAPSISETRKDEVRKDEVEEDVW